LFLGLRLQTPIVPGAWGVPPSWHSGGGGTLGLGAERVCVERVEAEAILDGDRETAIGLLLRLDDLAAANERLVGANERLEGRVAELERRLNGSSRNSSLPPSQDPPSAPPRPSGKGSGRKRGGQPGHEGRYRRLLPPGQVDELIEHWPERCLSCAHEFAETERVDAIEPSRRQVAELPPIAVRVTEHRLHRVWVASSTSSRSARRRDPMPPIGAERGSSSRRPDRRFELNSGVVSSARVSDFGARSDHQRGDNPACGPRTPRVRLVTVRERSELDEVIRKVRDVLARALEACADFLRPKPSAQDPVEALLDAAPIDDEPVTADDAAAIERGRADFERGETISLDEIKRKSA
jgi:hypothetical protein